MTGARWFCRRPGRWTWPTRDPRRQNHRAPVICGRVVCPAEPYWVGAQKTSRRLNDKLLSKVKLSERFKCPCTLWLNFLP